MTGAVRTALGALGLLLAAYGGWLLLSRGHDLLGVATWLVAGVLLHDAVLAVVTVALGGLAVRLAPVALRAPLVVGFVVLGPLTLLAVPVLGRFGARADNPTLLDRDYTTGWLVLAGLTALAVAVAALVRSRSARR
ncbi:hypothetical protein GON03_02245 [Nocardioides sp. MAH-18]|uniref:Uncharacterized protein n=1 Tax=Nocardioides agri TaxID=2682843 RepID=A0A6L6XMM8_9ACTN|nr:MULTISPECIES: hypothetical protein [unclassified Nocardioides]MBA2953114.1 hypothetical protein [Nocardioides sp. CGMCC 1.13656]MVQ47983.1 hypothetical protein [Nocardioides sp. MAH-18]